MVFLIIYFHKNIIIYLKNWQENIKCINIKILMKIKEKFAKNDYCALKRLRKLSRRTVLDPAFRPSLIFKRSNVSHPRWESRMFFI